MAQALREAYPDLIVINENISRSDRDAIIGRFKSLHDSSDVVAEAQARTFLGLLALADLKVPETPSEFAVKDIADASISSEASAAKPATANTGLLSGVLPLTYRFEVQLPATKDVEVFRAIFRAMREELFNA